MWTYDEDKIKNDLKKMFFGDYEKKFMLSLENKTVLQFLRQTMLEFNYSIPDFLNKTGISFQQFCEELQQSNILRAYDEAKGPSSFDGEPRDLPNDCQWPDCSENKALQKDHMIPKSLFDERFYGNFMRNVDYNLLFLCPIHNRMKTNSLMIGLVFLMNRNN